MPALWGDNKALAARKSVDYTILRSSYSNRAVSSSNRTVPKALLL